MSLMRSLFGCCLLTLVLLPAASTMSADDASSNWNQWRGPSRTGVIEGDLWPKTLDEDALKQVWKVDLGPSYSGPIVADGRVFTTETRDRKFEVVRAFDSASGKELWKTEWEGAMSVPFFAKANGDWIRSTPAWDEGRLYVAGMRDVLVCLNADDGEAIWKVDFVKAGVGVCLFPVGGWGPRLRPSGRVAGQAQQGHGRGWLAIAERRWRNVWQRLQFAGNGHHQRYAATGCADAEGPHRRRS